MTTEFDDNDDKGYLEAVGDFKPGSITKIKLTNFMTHSDVEILPGSRLNTVIGPNGTGKSTILNAICLGLGGDPKLLGRADDLRAFIQNGQTVATIEVHLAPHPGREPHVFKRVLDANKGSSSKASRGRGSSTCFINGEKASVKQVRQIVSETYQIAIDNLCTFLPQDKVGNFSGFTDQQRLLETEKTFGGGALAINYDDDDEEEAGEGKNLLYYNVHQELIKAEEDLLSSEGNVETVRDQLKKLQHELEQLEREKDRMEERQKAIEQANLYRKKKLWLKFEALREQAIELKDQKLAMKEKVKAAQQQLRPLEDRHTHAATERKNLETRLKEIDHQVQAHKKEMEKQVQKYEKHDEEIENILVQIQTLESKRSKLEKELENARKHLKEYEELAGSSGSKETIEKDFKQANADLKKARQQYDKAKRELRGKSEELKELEDRAKSIQSKLAKLTDGAAIRKERILGQYKNLGKICAWLDKNRQQFRRPVWGPIVCEVNTKSHNVSAFLEFHVQNSTLKAFVVETDEDYKKLYSLVRRELNVPINVINVKNGRLKEITRMYSDQKMKILKQEHGVVGYLDEAFTAPDPVLQALRDYGRVHEVLVGGEKTKHSIDHKELMQFLNEPDQWSSQPTKRRSGGVFSSQGDRSFRNLVNKSRYADSANVRQDDVQPAKMLAPGTNARVQKEREEELAAVHEQINIFRPSLHEMQKKVSELESISQDANLKAQHNKKTKESWMKLQDKIKRARNKVQDCENELQQDDDEEKKKCISQLISRTRHSISALDSHKDERRKMIEKTIVNAGATLGKSQSLAAERAARQALEEAKQEHNSLVAQASETQKKYNEVRSKATQSKNAAEAEAPLTDANGDPLPLKAELEALEVSTLAEVEAALEDAEQTVTAIQANDNVFQQYENLQNEVAEVQEQLDQVSSSKDSKLALISEKREPWERVLRTNISKINDKFARYMKEMGCTGEVRLKRGSAEEQQEGNNVFANFKEWGIEILVSYRENAKAQILSAERHSGGERSVATILYLMALQEMMITPFRCVDEINQGLDERNERLVFRRIVANSTSPPKNNNPFNHSGQYFLITPKLLPHLTDMENEAATVLCVFNGSYSFENPTDWKMENMLVGDNTNKRTAADVEEGEENRENARNGARRKKKKIPKYAG